VRLALPVLAASVVLLLTACNPFTNPYEDHQRDGGITPDQAEEALLSIEGVSDADYGTYEWYNPGEGGMFSSSGMDVVLNITIDPEYSIADHEAFLEYAAATAWSVNDHYPKGSVVIQLVGGEDLNYDWEPVAADVFPGVRGFTDAASMGWDEEDAEWYIGGRVLSVSAATYGERFGEWPGDEVDAPSGLLANVPVTAIVLPAITDLRLIVDAESCYFLSYERSGETASYSGDVTVTLRDSAGAELQTEVVTDQGIFARFCFDEGDLPEGATADVSTGPDDAHEFLPVTETVDLTDV